MLLSDFSLTSDNYSLSQKNSVVVPLAIETLPRLERLTDSSLGTIMYFIYTDDALTKERIA